MSGNYITIVGAQKFTGDHTLVFVRHRYAFIKEKCHGVQNQQIFRKVLLTVVLSATFASIVAIAHAPTGVCAGACLENKRSG